MTKNRKKEGKQNSSEWKGKKNSNKRREERESDKMGGRGGWINRRRERKCYERTVTEMREGER